ncbi:hypothetical protein Hsar01_03396 [Haloferula sargassicola]|uniref:DUF2339 domain-containing protein n=1 Tax=Haloferula sargassicola TaxID=490096 RepID=A0ABP9URJ1_9BACT
MARIDGVDAPVWIFDDLARWQRQGERAEWWLMDDENPEIARLRAKLDELAALQAEQVAALRREIHELERKQPPMEAARPATPGEIPAAVEPPPVPQEELPVPELPEPVLPPMPGRNLELDFGRVWLVRIGVVLLVTGLVLLGNYAYRNWIRDLSAGLRLAALVASALAIGGAGWWCTLREKTRAFGEVLLAGGMAFFYWCAYAAHHVPRLRVIDSALLSTGVLLGAAAAIVGVSVKRNARVTAVMGLLLAAYSTVLQPMNWLSAGSNLLLAAAGVGLAAWKQWRGPGVAAMVGTYGAYFFWHLAGAAGGGVEAASLAFPALLWAVFASPTLARGGLPGFSEYGRGWWTGLNNAAGFGLFLLTWIELGKGELWLVPAGWGVAWLAIGGWMRGRSRGTETYLVQGLVALTAALVMKLDGYQLGLGLAIEALVMAGAFWRFRKWPELAFSVLAMVGAFGWAIELESTPLWCLASMAVVLAGAAALLRRARPEDWLKAFSRTGAALVALGAAGVGLTWWWRLPQGWQAAVAAAVALGLSPLVLSPARRERSGELLMIVLAWCGAVAVAVLSFGETEGSLWLTAGLSLVAGVLWERLGKPATEDTREPVGLMASTVAWTHGVTAMVVALAAIALQPEASVRFWMEGALAVVLPLAAWHGLRCPRLRAAGTLALVVWLGDTAYFESRHPDWLVFLVPLAAWAVWAFAGYGGKWTSPGTALHAAVSRSVGCLGWLFAWQGLLNHGWIDAIALSTLGGWWVFRRLRQVRRPIELWVWAVICLGGLTIEMGGEAGPRIPPGWGVAAALVVAVFLKRKRAVGLDWLAVGVSTVWASDWLADRHGWTAVTLLWTALGFGWVTAGLWRGNAAVRVGGFALLLISLAKLFIHDVWEFGTFTRVVAFLALGVALVVLGFFYNRFADLLKKLVQDEGGGERWSLSERSVLRLGHRLHFRNRAGDGSRRDGLPDRGEIGCGVRLHAGQRADELDRDQGDAEIDRGGDDGDRGGGGEGIAGVGGVDGIAGEKGEDPECPPGGKKVIGRRAGGGGGEDVLHGLVGLPERGDGDEIPADGPAGGVAHHRRVVRGADRGLAADHGEKMGILGRADDPDPKDEVGGHDRESHEGEQVEIG